MQAGDKVRLKANPSRIGVLGSETDGPPARQRVLVSFMHGTEEFILPGALERWKKGARALRIDQVSPLLLHPSIAL